MQARDGRAHIVLEAGVVAQQHDAGVGPQPLKVGRVGAVPAHQNHCRHLHRHDNLEHDAHTNPIVRLLLDPSLMPGSDYASAFFVTL